MINLKWNWSFKTKEVVKRTLRHHVLQHPRWLPSGQRRPRVHGAARGPSSPAKHSRGNCLITCYAATLISDHLCTVYRNMYIYTQYIHLRNLLMISITIDICIFKGGEKGVWACASYICICMCAHISITLQHVLTWWDQYFMNKPFPTILSLYIIIYLSTGSCASQSIRMSASLDFYSSATSMYL